METFETDLHAAQPLLLAFIGAICGAPDVARDILGEVNLMLIRRRNLYDPSRPFLPWARAFAYNEVRRWRKDHSNARIVFSDDLVARLAEMSDTDRIAADERWHRRVEALREAESELTPEMRYLLTRHYVSGEGLDAIGAQVKRSAHSVAVSLHYIRRVLRKSIEAKLKEAES